MLSFLVIFTPFHSFAHKKIDSVFQDRSTKPCHSWASCDLRPSHGPRIDIKSSTAITLALTWITLSSRMTLCCSDLHWIWGKRDSPFGFVHCCEASTATRAAHKKNQNINCIKFAFWHVLVMYWGKWRCIVYVFEHAL